jgi:hypothetical protein
MIPNVDDVRELRRLGRQEDPAAMRQRWDAATGLEARAELQRLEEVEKIIGGFCTYAKCSALEDQKVRQVKIKMFGS